MADAIAIPTDDLDRAAHVAAAGARDDAEADILAAVAHHIVLQHPSVSTAQLHDAISELHAAIGFDRPARQVDLAMNRLLTRVNPVLTSPVLRVATGDYTRAFFESHRRGTRLLRQVEPIELQFDRFSELARLRRGCESGEVGAATQPGCLRRSRHDERGS
jgi:hypothetical protein